MEDAGVVRVTPASAQLTVIETGPAVLLAALLSTAEVIDAESVSCGQDAVLAVVVTFTFRMSPGVIVPKLQVRRFLALIEQAPALGPVGVHVPGGSWLVRTTLVDGPGPLAVTPMSTSR